MKFPHKYNSYAINLSFIINDWYKSKRIKPNHTRTIIIYIR